jgi:hypothetical protein
MSEEKMVELVRDALRERGIEHEVVAAGQFNPRVHSGGLFVGGLAGGDAGSLLGGMGESVGMGAGRSRACAPPTPPLGCPPRCSSAPPPQRCRRLSAPKPLPVELRRGLRWGPTKAPQSQPGS